MEQNNRYKSASKKLDTLLRCCCWESWGFRPEVVCCLRITCRILEPEGTLSFSRRDQKKRSECGKLKNTPSPKETAPSNTCECYLTWEKVLCTP